jgi:hypothetical protein
MKKSGEIENRSLVKISGDQNDYSDNPLICQNFTSWTKDQKSAIIIAI